MPRPTATPVSLWGHRRRWPLPPGHLVSQPGAVLLVGAVEGTLTKLGMLETEVHDLASLATSGLLTLPSFVVALLATLLVGGLFPGRHGSHDLATFVF